MKKVLVALVAAGVVSFAASSPAAAQSDAAIVKVPFQFIVGQHVLPAGSYRVAPQTADWSVVSVIGLKGAPAALVGTDGLEKSLPSSSKSQLTFTNYHGHYFLQAVAVPGIAREVRVTKMQAERTLAKLNLLSAEPANVAK